MKASVVGGGSWGLALANVLADNGHQVQVYMRNPDSIEEFNSTRTVNRYLPEVSLNKDIKAVANYNELKGSEIVVYAVPTQQVRSVLEKTSHLYPGSIFVNVSKGIELGSNKRVSQIFSDFIDPANFVTLSGPSHAEEVAVRMPTAVVSSSMYKASMEKVQDAFMNNYFRVYTNADLVGVELGGATKNILALAIGAVEGLGYGDNTSAAIMTRGMHEIVRLGIEVGGNPATFYGLTGMGDMIVTAFSKHSRNRRAGLLLGQGCNIEEVEKKVGMVVEGLTTTKAVYALAKELNVDMPITRALYKVLFDGISPEDIAQELMDREKKTENLY